MEKIIYTLKEMRELGYPINYLNGLIHIKGQDFAWKKNPAKRNSPVLVDMERFERWKDKQIKLSRGV